MSIVISDKLIEALEGAGIIEARTRVRRVVIDLQVKCPPIIHIERFGDERLIDVFRSLDGVEIRESRSAEPTYWSRDAAGNPVSWQFDDGKAECTCPLIDVSKYPSQPDFVRGDPLGCPVHGNERDADVAAAMRRARER